MVHTRYFTIAESARRAYDDNEAGARQHSIRPVEQRPQCDAKMEATARMVKQFVEHYPRFTLVTE
jgi:hypothetical protein